MHAGSLRQRVTLQTATETTDRFGKRSKAWTDVATRWARVEPLTGREAVQALAVRSDLTHKVTLRAGITIGPEMRLIFQSRVLQIESVANLDERGRELVVMAREVVGGT